MWFAVAAAAVALVALSLVEIIKTKEPCTGCPDTPAAFCTLAAAPCSKVGLGKSKKVQQKDSTKDSKDRNLLQDLWGEDTWLNLSATDISYYYCLL